LHMLLKAQRHQGTFFETYGNIETVKRYFLCYKKGGPRKIGGLPARLGSLFA
jgi:hypothetical protein